MREIYALRRIAAWALNHLNLYVPRCDGCSIYSTNAYLAYNREEDEWWTYCKTCYWDVMDNPDIDKDSVRKCR